VTNSVVKLTLPGGRGYDIRIGAGVNASLGESIAALTPHRSVALIADSNVAPLYAADVAAGLEAAGFAVAQFMFEAGEGAKTLSQAEELHTALSSFRFARDSVVIALGGGVAGDLAGFVAATYMRGVPFVQVPTTLLSMIDSSVGGKNGVNVAGVKNLVGTFAQPIHVSADLDVLGTLPELEWRCGFAEMAKSAIIDSADFSAWLFDAAPALVAHEGDVLREAIARTVAFKARIVVADERESSLRACLNYGHTLGHAIEALADNPKVHHGIAVAEGMRFAAMVADDVLGTVPGFADAQDQLLTALGVEPMARRFDVDALVDKMVHDKKADGANVRFVLAKAPGDWELCTLEPDVVAEYVRKWMEAKEL